MIIEFIFTVYEWIIYTMNNNVTRKNDRLF